MILEKYDAIRENHIPDYNVPEEFFMAGNSEDNYCIFLISCLSKDKFIHLDQNFSELTGYPNEKFIEDGMDFWFSIIHPADMEAVTEKIISAHKAMFSPDVDPENPTPLILEYRFKHANGNWVGVRDTRYLISFNADKVIDKVLCKFESIPTDEFEIRELTELLNKENSCTKMLEQAMVHKNAKSKQTLDGVSVAARNNPAYISRLTRREKEILQLIAQGLSTKMIADQCFISIHTVETHRRHLLEKLEVKNSMELIKEASKVFWL